MSKTAGICRAGLVLGGLLLVGATAWAQQSLLARLKSEFEERQYVSRFDLGNYVVGEHPSTHQRLPRLVDTEYYLDGTVKYYVCRGFAGSASLTDLLVKGYYAPASAIAATPSGSQFWVLKVELKDDRVELFLSRQSNLVTPRDYAKLKVMLGRGYQSWDYEKIVAAIARGLKVERFERAYALEDDYRALKVAVGNAEGVYKATAAADVDARLDAATRLRDACRALADNRTKYAALGHPNPEAAEYEARASAMDAEIGQAREAKAAARIQSLQQRFAAAIAAARTASASGRGLKVSSEADWQRKVDWVAKYETTVADVRKAQKELTDAGGTPPPADVQWIEAEEQAVVKARQDLPRERGRLALTRLDTEYRAMERKRAELQDAYMKAFGSGTERTLLRDLSSHLEQMHRNRLEAERAGSKTAGAQAAQLLKDIKKTQ